MSDPLAMPQMIEANGLTFGFHTLGTGKLLLLLHGFPDTARAWEPVMAPVAAAGYKVVAPYLRGYAPTAIPPTDTTIDDLGADALGLIAAFGTDSAVVVGQDWGAAAGYSAAASDPDRVSRLVTVALPHPAGFKPKLKDVWAARHFASFRRRKAGRKFVASDFGGLRKIYRRWSPQWDFTEADLDDSKRCLSNTESREAIFGYYRAAAKPARSMRHKISVPTVAFAGLTDGVTPRRAFDAAASRFTGPYEVLELPGGHFAHRENPTLFIEKLLEALAA